MKNKPNTTGILFGLALIAVGVGYAGNAIGLWSGFTIFFRGWWTVFIILPCFASILDHGPKSGNIGGLLTGVILLVLRQLSIKNMFILAMPMVLIVLGLVIVFRSRPFGHRKIMNAETGTSFFMPVFRAVLNAKKITLPAEPFGGAEVSAVCAGLSLDLTNAVIDKDVTVYTSSVFGPVEIIVPATHNLRVQKTAGFSRVDNQAKNYTDIVNMPTIYMNCKCYFSNTIIRNS